MSFLPSPLRRALVAGTVALAALPALAQETPVKFQLDSAFRPKARTVVGNGMDLGGVER